MKKIIIIITCFIGLSGAFAQQRGMFHNPVIEADVPDPSMIRVGNYYYLVSTTMHLMPGCPVMRSKDLVHWETISYVFQRLTDLPPHSPHGNTSPSHRHVSVLLHPAIGAHPPNCHHSAT